MKIKNPTVPLLILSILALVIGISLKNSIELGICLLTEPSCINLYTRAGNEVFYGAGALTIIFLVLILVPKAFPAWKKFAIWFVPLAALLFIFYPHPGSGDLFSPYPETVFKWVSGAYILISLVIILTVSLKKMPPQ